MLRLFAYLEASYPEGIDNTFNTLGCEDLLSMCRGYSHCVAWFSYWFDNLGFISEGNTYCRCAASSLPLWGNTDVASSDIRARECYGKRMFPRIFQLCWKLKS